MHHPTSELLSFSNSSKKTDFPRSQEGPQESSVTRDSFMGAFIYLQKLLWGSTLCSALKENEPLGSALERPGMIELLLCTAVSQMKSFGCPRSLMTMVINVPYFIGKEMEVQRGWMPCPKCPGAWLPPPHRWLLQMGLGKPEGPRDLCLWSKRSKRFYDEELAFFAIIFSCMHSGVFQKLQDLRSHNKRSWGILVSSADICKNVEQYYSPYYFFILKMFFIRILYATMRCVCCYF